MLDLQRCIFSRVDEANVTTAKTVSAEGRILISTLGSDGEETVEESAGGASEKIAGISYNTNLTPTQFPNVETGTIPAATPYTIQLVKTNLVSAEIRIYASTTGELSNDTAVHPTTPDAGKFSCNYTTGLVYFNAAQASETVTIWYRYQPTTLEATTRWFEAAINANSGGTFNQIGVIKFPCVIYTSEYNSAVSFAAATSLKTAASGKITDQTGGGTTMSTARVIHVPDTDNVYLGVEFLAL